MGIFSIFGEKKSDEPIKENDTDESQSIAFRLQQEVISSMPETLEEPKIEPVPALQSTHFHPDIKDLLWFADGPMKNIQAGQPIKKQTFSGVTITYAAPGLEEPSMIFVSQAVEIPIDTSKVERPPYYPTYAGLTSPQKWTYLKLLENPYNNSIDIGFVFILYYGLERHILYGNWEKAVDVILKLRDVHTNKSFQQYSANALVLASILHGKGEIAQSLLLSLDKEYEINNFPANLYMMCAASFNIPLTAKDIMRLSSNFGFNNKLYIKKYPDIFIETLEQKINKNKGRKYLLVSDFLSWQDINTMQKHSIKVFANTSLSETTVSIPFITSSAKIVNPMFNLLQETHEAVKSLLTERRKNGTLPLEAKSTVKPRHQKTIPELISDLREAEKSYPIPAAYSKAITALRGIKKLDKNNAENYIKQMYDLAVKYSMMIDYSEVCQCTGYSVFEIIPQKVIDSLEYTYDQIGYNELKLLSKTDIKEIVELWGEPSSHSTLNKMYQDVWHKYEIKLNKMIL